MLNDVAALATGATHSTEPVPVGSAPAGILMVQPVIRCEHGYEVSAYSECGDLLARACLTGSQLMSHVSFPAGIRAVRVEVENITGCEEHPHTYEISLLADEDTPHAA
ncbi:hypothetical protein GCM10018980_58480 [Streptomyces capoamus]|uniref:Uncharacterized protein n=1 Tax=Streptomyces capoamus TaxID=68183 RepID=A0A919KEB0_9ACTN|nr:hypothetical protein [Streptomyces capoamus]GGW18662.1 hypothetical protein GCM10010501_48180 [Streptomyces libani subsp. rufus]GHG66242.1 hypothetical protein GCM10018980_58480 [Streptomyces capoamus]